MEQTYATLIELFPLDLINIILLYSDSKIIVHLQNYFPHLFGHIIINGEDVALINKNNYKYVNPLR